MITAQKCNIKMKKCKILPFQNHQFNKNSVFGPFFVDYPLLPADMINFLLYTVSAISFAPEKVVRTWGEPQKKSFFTNIWSLSQICQKQGWALKNDPLLGNGIFLGGGPNGKVVAPGILVIWPVDKKCTVYLNLT